MTELISALALVLAAALEILASFSRRSTLKYIKSRAFFSLALVFLTYSKVAATSLSAIIPKAFAAADLAFIALWLAAIYLSILTYS